MEIVIENMEKKHWEEVVEIYHETAATGVGTFCHEPMSWTEWDKNHMQQCRLVAKGRGKVIGWIALRSISNTCFDKGVAEVSIFVAKEFHKKRIGSILLFRILNESEEFGIWSLICNIPHNNIAVIGLLKKYEFREVGHHEKVGKDVNGVWQNSILLERRSKVTGIE